MVGTSSRRPAALAAAVIFGLLGATEPGFAQNIERALTHAYRNNPDLNAARAGVRVANEGVPAALSGYRPSVNMTLTAGGQAQSTQSAGQPWRNQSLLPRSASITATQPLFDGNRTANTVRQADQNVMVARETLRNTEQTVLLASATAYMNVLREQAVLDLQRRNAEVLREQLRATRDRFSVGEVTRTDVALAESALQGALAQVAVAESDLANARGVFRQQIGVDAPTRLQPARTVERLLPPALETALISAQSEHPAIRGARHGADASMLAVRIAESALYPQLSLSSTLTRSADSGATAQFASANLLATLTIPIFASGGQSYALVRQAKESYGQRRIQIDTAMASVRQATVQSWAALTSARAQIRAAEEQVRAQEIALNGIREEYRVGQRTIIDVLTQTQNLLSARVALVRAQRDRVVLSYSVLSSMGRLNAQRLALATEIFDPTEHYEQVRDRWIGVRTPDGR